MTLKMKISWTNHEEKQNAPTKDSMGQMMMAYVSCSQSVCWRRWKLRVFPLIDVKLRAQRACLLRMLITERNAHQFVITRLNSTFSPPLSDAHPLAHSIWSPFFLARHTGLHLGCPSRALFFVPPSIPSLSIDLFLDVSHSVFSLGCLFHSQVRYLSSSNCCKIFRWWFGCVRSSMRPCVSASVRPFVHVSVWQGFRLHRVRLVVLPCFVRNESLLCHFYPGLFWGLILSPILSTRLSGSFIVNCLVSLAFFGFHWNWAAF